MGNVSKWKESLVERTIPKQNTNLMRLVYGEESASHSTNSVDEAHHSSEDEESEDDEFFKPKGEGNKVCCSSYCYHQGVLLLEQEALLLDNQNLNSFGKLVHMYELDNGCVCFLTPGLI